jgi:hypothetical protein
VFFFKHYSILTPYTGTVRLFTSSPVSFKCDVFCLLTFLFLFFNPVIIIFHFFLFIYLCPLFQPLLVFFLNMPFLLISSFYHSIPSFVYHSLFSIRIAPFFKFRLTMFFRLFNSFVFFLDFFSFFFSLYFHLFILLLNPPTNHHFPSHSPFPIPALKSPPIRVPSDSSLTRTRRPFLEATPSALPSPDLCIFCFQTRPARPPKELLIDRKQPLWTVSKPEAVPLMIDFV